MRAGRNVATIEAVQGLLQQEASGASEQPVVCTSNDDQQSLLAKPLAEEALAILQQSISRQEQGSSNAANRYSSRELTGKV